LQYNQIITAKGEETMGIFRKKPAGEGSLFDSIASAYGMFYRVQVKRYGRVIDRMSKAVDLSGCSNIIDVGCGTGALCAAFSRRGFKMTGVDSSAGMLEVASSKAGNEGTEFIRASVLEGLPFEDGAFDASVASFVAHGLQPGERRAMYAEMARVTKRLVIIYDYNERRTLATDIAERLEGGDYFNFIKTAEAELRESFGSVRKLDAGKFSSWYVCEKFLGGI
jgi:ubiquinone/menaquinone biosynthesis C-methylase UbiE